MTRYHRGASYERDVIKKLLKDEDGIFALRGAGSKSYGKMKVDLIVLTPQALIVVQCKKSKRKFTAEKKQFLKFPLPKYVEVRRIFCEA